MAVLKQTFSTVATPQATGSEPEIVISTITADRDSDEIVPEGADLAPYRRNPVVQFGHDYSSLPIGSTTSIDVAPGRGIRARWRWLEGDPFAARVRNAFEQGVLRAASIGFMPLASEPNGKGGRRFTEWQLLEWSLVPVPANPEAVRTLKALNLWRAADGDVLELTDDEDDVAVDLLDSEDDESVVAAADVAAALPAIIAGCVADELTPAAIRRAVTDELLRRRGHIPDGVDPLGDTRARRLTPKQLHEYGW